MTTYLRSIKLLSLSILFLSLPMLSVSTSRTVSDHKTPKTGFRVALKHVDSGKNLTKFERVQRGIKRGNHRLETLYNAVVLSTTSGGGSTTSDLQTPIHAGNGEFLMDLSIGTPAESYSAILDTGSDLIWTQCEPCQQCFDQPTPIYDPKRSKSFKKVSCSNNNALCKSLPQSTCGNDDGCEYLYTYGDYSSTQGVLATETFTFGEVSVGDIGFGCGDDNEGNGFTQGGGLVGLGRGSLSLVSQLKQPKFGYCLTSIDDSKTSSTLFIGSSASGDALETSSSSSIKTTPLIRNPSQPSFYYLSLEGISVGDVKLRIKESTFALQEDGSGGLIIDSGTTITYLEASGFDELKREFISQMKLKVDDSGSSGLDVCFVLPTDSSDFEVPKLVFHFKEADLELGSENYMVGDSSMGVVCLAMGRSNGMSIFGNVQQQNILVVHDLEKQTLSFVPKQCDKL